MLESVEDQQLEKREEEIEINPAPPVPDVDDYPDGGLAAWSIVLGVSPSAISSPSQFTDEIGPRSLRVRFSRRRLNSTTFVPNRLLNSGTVADSVW